jgi:hypothetical protein
VSGMPAPGKRTRIVEDNEGSADRMMWTVDAACDLDPSWTNDNRPSDAAEAEMRAICSGCTVMTSCAAYGLARRVESGFYAGVWIPAIANGKSKWLDARRHLEQRAHGIRP